MDAGSRYPTQFAMPTSSPPRPQSPFSPTHAYPMPQVPLSRPMVGAYPFPPHAQLNLKMADLSLHDEKPMKGEPEACLFVASLNAQRTDDQLTDSVTKHFSKWGPLMNVKVMKDWMNRPYAFVQYGYVQDARRALEESHDTIVDGRHIRVEQARVNRTLFLAKLPKTMTEEAIKKYLEKWGQIEGITLLYNHATGKSKGCGFAKFRYREDAIRAYLHIRQQNKWSVEWAANIEKQQPERDRHSVFIGQLNAGLVTHELVERRFSQYGPIESLHVVNKNGEAFAFLRYEDEESAQLAIKIENDSMFLDRRIKVQYREVPECRTPKKMPPTLPLQLPTPGASRVVREEPALPAETSPYAMSYAPDGYGRGFPIHSPLDIARAAEYPADKRFLRPEHRMPYYANTSAPNSPSPPISPTHMGAFAPIHSRAASSPAVRFPSLGYSLPPTAYPGFLPPSASAYHDPTPLMQYSREYPPQSMGLPPSPTFNMQGSSLGTPPRAPPRVDMSLYGMRDYA